MGVALQMLTNPPVWLSVSLIAFIILIMIITLLWPSKRADKQENENISIAQKLFSFINTGHINQNVSIGNTQREITDDFKNQFPLIVKNITARKFHLHCNYNDPESVNFAMQLKEFFIGKGYEYNGLNSHTGISGGDGRCIIEVDDDTIHVTIGLNISTDSLLNIGSGLSTGMGKI